MLIDTGYAGNHDRDALRIAGRRKQPVSNGSITW
jgi:hypothetical protein